MAIYLCIVVNATLGNADDSATKSGITTHAMSNAPNPRDNTHTAQVPIIFCLSFKHQFSL